MALTKVSYSMIDGAIVNVRDFGAVGDGVADDTAAIQAAVDSVVQGTVFFPNGTYKITNTINIDASTKLTLNLRGNGRATIIKYDGTTPNIPMVYYQKGSNSAFSIIENLTFENNFRTGDTVLNAISAIRIGEKNALALDGNNGTCNVTIRKNLILYAQRCIEIFSESDQITIEDNYLFVFTEHGILCTVAGPLVVSGTQSAAVRVLNNQIAGAQQDAINVRVSGAACSVQGNVIQSAERMMGIHLVNCSAFRVSDNYFESLSLNTNLNYAVLSEGSFAGYIGDLQIGGYAGANLIVIDANSHDINIGTNFHATSGGNPLSFVAINAAATGISIIGKQYSDGISTNSIGGLPDFQVDGNGNLKSSTSVKAPLVTSTQTSVNVAGAGSFTMFTAVANGCYLVNVSQEEEDYAATAIVTVIGNTATVNVDSIYSTNANLSITATGLDIKVNNGIGATRTVFYGFIRIA